MPDGLKTFDLIKNRFYPFLSLFFTDSLSNSLTASETIHLAALDSTDFIFFAVLMAFLFKLGFLFPISCLPVGSPRIPQTQHGPITKVLLLIVLLSYIVAFAGGILSPPRDNVLFLHGVASPGAY